MRTGIEWGIGVLMLAMVVGGCRPSRSAGTPIAVTVPVVPTAALISASTTAPTSAPASAPVAPLPTQDAAAALAVLLPTVTPTPAARPISLPSLPASWQLVTPEVGAPEASIAAESALPFGQMAQATIFAVPTYGLDLHTYLRGVVDELAEQSNIALLNARLDDTLRDDRTPVARLDFTITPPQGEPLAAIQVAHLDGDHFIVLTVSAPESVRAELEIALRDLLTVTTQGQ